MTGYESVRRLTHENLLPALERFIVLASRLRGLSRFRASNRDLGLSRQDLDKIMDTVSCLQLIAHQILIVSGNELRQFHAFSTWLRQEIDTQASEASGPESVNTATSIDHAGTLQYIEGAMMGSALDQYINLQPSSSQDCEWFSKAEGGSLFELYKAEVEKATGGSHTQKQLPRLDSLITHLATQCNTAFHAIAETQRRNVRFSRPLPLSKALPELFHMRMVQEVVCTAPLLRKVTDVR